MDSTKPSGLYSVGAIVDGPVGKLPFALIDPHGKVIAKARQCRDANLNRLRRLLQEAYNLGLKDAMNSPARDR